jgi:hypothetical protein
MTDRYLTATELWGIDENGQKYLMNEIKSTSRFSSVELSKNESSMQHTPEVQLKIARELREGWKIHGPHPHRKYEIVQKWNDGDVVVV